VNLSGHLTSFIGWILGGGLVLCKRMFARYGEPALRTRLDAKIGAGGAPAEWRVNGNSAFMREKVLRTFRRFQRRPEPSTLYRIRKVVGVGLEFLRVLSDFVDV
jgi:hypothetical protein